MRDPRYYWGIGYGADMNGFGAQGRPRTGATNPVGYPFKSFDGKVTIDKLRSGERVYDINVDGVAHYGLYPDWVQDLRMIAGDEIVEDLARGSESYLQMWERAVGVPEQRCQPARARFGSGGLARWRLGDDTTSLLRRAGQPLQRPGRVWSYCLQARDKRAPGAVKVVLTPEGKVGLVVSTGPEHEAAGVGTGDRMRGSGLRVPRPLRLRPAVGEGVVRRPWRRSPWRRAARGCARTCASPARAERPVASHWLAGVGG